MRSSDFDCYITISAPVVTQDAIGEFVTTWETFVECFAKKTSRVGREFFAAGRVTNDARVYFAIRHIDGIDTKMTVDHEGKRYNIVDIRESDERRVSLSLECSEIS